MRASGSQASTTNTVVVTVVSTTNMASPFPGEGVTLIDNVTMDDHVEFHEEIISDQLLRNLNFYINALLCGNVALLGTVSNVINMAVFRRLSLRTSMNVNLFALSLTDFLLSFLILVTRFIPIWDLFFASDAVDPKTVDKIAFAWLDDPLFIISGWITAVLSMERCLCVTFPFRVKAMFTRKRSVAVVVVIYVVVVGTFMPIFATQWLEWTTVQITSDNETRHLRQLIPRYAENRPEIEYYVEIIVVSVLPIPSLCIVLVAVVWMVLGLNASAQLRGSMAASGENHESKITSRSRRLVKVVLLLAIIFTLCSIPRLSAAYLSMYNTDINAFGKENNLSDFLWNLARFATAVNASVNIFVYLTINASYRTEFKKLFPCSLKREKIKGFEQPL